MIAALLLGCVVSAPPEGNELALLKTFREEFVTIAPGTPTFPAEFGLGRIGTTAVAAVVIRFTKPFSIARYEVPQNLWEAVMGANPSKWKGPRNSVEMLSFAEANDFCNRATERMREAGLIGPTARIRLPSEAEWECAARAGTTTVYSFGDDVTLLDKFAWHTGNAAGNDPPVGAKLPNALGLYDMHGYLWEWCADTWGDDVVGLPTDGSPRTTGDATFGVLRSGSWKDKADKLTSSFRLRADRAVQDDAVGLRCVLTE